MKIRTVAINRDGRKVLINRSDFDPDNHIPWGADRSEWERDRARDEEFTGDIKKDDIVVGEGPGPEPGEWWELAQALVNAGYRKPHPNTKLETLREKVASL